MKGNRTLAEGTPAHNTSDTTSFAFTAALSNPSSQTVTVNYATADGTATVADGDSASGTLTFLPGEVSKTVTVLVQKDATVEPSETFTVNLAAPNNATIKTGTGTGTITNDD